MEHWTASETLSGDNAVYCDNCKERTTTRLWHVISRLPDYLFVHLKRFDFNLETLQNEKLNHRLEFKEKLNLSRYCAEDIGVDPSFELHGVVVHSGSCAYGHYYSYMNDGSGNWVELNDELVQKLQNHEEVLESDCFGGNGTSSRAQRGGRVRAANAANTRRRASAYMLVYTRKERATEPCAEMPPAKFNDPDLWRNRDHFYHREVAYTDIFSRLVYAIGSAALEDCEREQSCVPDEVTDLVLVTFFLFTSRVRSTAANLRDWELLLKSIIQVSTFDAVSGFIRRFMDNDADWLMQIVDVIPGEKERLMCSLVTWCLRRASQAPVEAEGHGPLDIFASACRVLLRNSVGIRSSLASEKLSTLLLFLPPNELAFQPDFRVSAALLRTDLPVSLLEQYFIAGDEYRVTYDSQANKLRQVQATALTVLLRLLQQAARLRDPADEQPLPVRAQYLVTVMNDNASQVFQKPDFWERLVANNAELLMTDDALLLEVVLQSCEPAKQPDLVHQCVSIIGRESYDDSAYVKTEAQKQVLEHTLRSLGPSVLEYVWQNYGLMPRREDEDPGAEREPKRARYSFNIPEDLAMMLISCAVSVFH
jgi:hypothetical protein